MLIGVRHMQYAGVLQGIFEEGQCGQAAAAVCHEPQQVPGLPVPHPVPRTGMSFISSILNV